MYAIRSYYDAAAVVFDENVIIEGINDSKKLSEKKREQLFDEIILKAKGYCIATASIAEIEEINILNAAMLAMKRAVEGLQIIPDIVLVDGNKTPDLNIRSVAVVKGDAISQCIAAASILAKVARDRYMKKLDEQYPVITSYSIHYTKLYDALQMPGVKNDFQASRSTLRV